MIWTAFIMGFAGSLHCLGMCSPLVMAVSNMSPNVLMSRLVYNGGRIFTYSIMGAIVGAVGAALMLGSYQNILSIALGLSLLLIAVTRTSLRLPFVTRMLGFFSLYLKSLFSTLLKRRGVWSSLLLGSLNGLLPCGVSLLALMYCISLSGPADGFVFMIGFGVGTLPAMLGLTGLFSWIATRLRLSVSVVTTGLLVLSGIALIARVFVLHTSHADHSAAALVDVVICR